MATAKADTISLFDGAIIARATRDWPGIAMGSGSRGPLAMVRAAKAAGVRFARRYLVGFSNGGYFAIELYNPYNTPITLANWQLATLTRLNGVVGVPVTPLVSTQACCSSR